MKRFLFLLFVVFYNISGAFAQSDSMLTVKVTGIENDIGYILLALYDKSEDWSKPEVAKYTRTVPAERGTMLIEFAHLAPGSYAIAALHDEDESHDMSYMPFGYPKEAYGFSNNVRGLLSSPKFHECVFEFDRSRMITIEVK